jgi:hypothetical protein
MKSGLILLLCALAFAGCTQSKPESIRTEVEYGYVPATAPSKGAPHFRAAAIVTSDHVLSETDEVGIIRTALSQWAHSRPRPMDNPSASVQSYVNKMKELKGVKIMKVVFEDFSPISVGQPGKLQQDN